MQKILKDIIIPTFLICLTISVLDLNTRQSIFVSLMISLMMVRDIINDN